MTVSKQKRSHVLTSNLWKTQQRQNIPSPFDGSLRLAKTPVDASFQSNLRPNGARSILEDRGRLANFSNAAAAFVTPNAAGKEQQSTPKHNEAFQKSERKPGLAVEDKHALAGI